MTSNPCPLRDSNKLVVDLHRKLLNYGFKYWYTLEDFAGYHGSWPFENTIHPGLIQSLPTYRNAIHIGIDYSRLPNTVRNIDNTFQLRLERTKAVNLVEYPGKGHNVKYATVHCYDSGRSIVVRQFISHNFDFLVDVQLVNDGGYL